MHIGYKAEVGTRKNWPHNQYGLISDVTMEGAGEGMHTAPEGDAGLT